MVTYIPFMLLMFFACGRLAEVHLAAEGHPLVGDKVYGANVQVTKWCPYIFLHCYWLGIVGEDVLCCHEAVPKIRNTNEQQEYQMMEMGRAGSGNWMREDSLNTKTANKGNFFQIQYLYLLLQKRSSSLLHEFSSS